MKRTGRMVSTLAVASILVLGAAALLIYQRYQRHHLSPELSETISAVVASSPCDPANAAHLRAAADQLHTTLDRVEFTRLQEMVGSCEVIAAAKARQAQREAEAQATADGRAHRLQLMVVMEQAYLLHNQPIPPALQSELDGAFTQDASRRAQLQGEQARDAALIASNTATAAQRFHQLHLDLDLASPAN